MDELEMKPWRDMTIPECKELMARVCSAVLDGLPPDTEGLIVIVCGGDGTLHSSGTVSRADMIALLLDFVAKFDDGETL